MKNRVSCYQQGLAWLYTRQWLSFLMGVIVVLGWLYNWRIAKKRVKPRNVERYRGNPRDWGEL